MRMILIALSFIAIQQNTYADPATENEAMQAALTARTEFVTALQNKDFAPVTHHAFDVAMNKLAEQIRTDYNDAAMADELLVQWNHSSAHFESSLTMVMIDLGDHDPLFPWINDYLNKAASKYGTIILTLPIVKDIQMLNYALPVVFSPRGGWQTDGKVDSMDARIEYRKHFIPFANFVTYYASLFACEYIAQKNNQPDLKKLCKKAAEKLEFLMGRYVAPVVSDWIFKQTNRSIQIGDDRLVYTTPSDLANAIKH